MKFFSPLQTKPEREMVVLEVLTEYISTEAFDKTPTNELAGSLLRVMARTIVTFAALVEANALAKNGGDLASISDDLVGFLQQAIDISILKWEAMPANQSNPKMNDKD